MPKDNPVSRCPSKWAHGQRQLQSFLETGFLSPRAEIPPEACMHGKGCQQLTSCVGTAGGEDQHSCCKPSQEHRDRGYFSLGWWLTTVPPEVMSLNHPAAALICTMWDAESNGVVQPREGMVKGVSLLSAAAL